MIKRVRKKIQISLPESSSQEKRDRRMEGKGVQPSTTS